MIEHYTVCNSPYARDLGEVVNEHIKMGWQPYGSMSVVIGAGHIYTFFQPMVKYAPTMSNNQ